MRNFALSSRFGAWCVVLLLFVVVHAEVDAQAAAETAAAKSAASDELSQTDLLRSYLKMREELQATQMAIVNNRVGAVTEKLDAIKASMEAERERQQLEIQRVNAERERVQLEAQRANRLLLWVAVGFGGVGLLAMLLLPIFQWRAINRMTEVVANRPPLPGPVAALPAGEGLVPSEQAVTQSNQRLLSVIERMEKRIFELEHTTVPPLPAAPAKQPTPAGSTTTNTSTNGISSHGADAVRRAAAASDQTTWITVLLSKGRSLLSTNKVIEAVACYDEVLKLESNHPEALVRKGAALERLNRYEEALQCYERAIQSDGKMTFAYVSKGGVCNRLGRYDEALECYEQALRVQEKAR